MTYVPIIDVLIVAQGSVPRGIYLEYEYKFRPTVLHAPG